MGNKTPTRNSGIRKADWQRENDLAEWRKLTLNHKREKPKSNTIYAAEWIRGALVPGEVGVQMALKQVHWFKLFYERDLVPSFSLPSLAPAHYLPWQDAQGFSFGKSKTSL